MAAAGVIPFPNPMGLPAPTPGLRSGGRVGRPGVGRHLGGRPAPAGGAVALAVQAAPPVAGDPVRRSPPSHVPNDEAMKASVSCWAASMRFSAPAASSRPSTGISQSDSARMMAMTTGTRCSAVSKTT